MASMCRLCLSNKTSSDGEETTDIFQDNLPFKIYKYLNIEVSKNDGFPDIVCMNCLNTLLQFDTFRDMCQNCDAYIRQKYAADPTMKQNILLTDTNIADKNMFRNNGSDTEMLKICRSDVTVDTFTSQIVFPFNSKKKKLKAKPPSKDNLLSQENKRIRIQTTEDISKIIGNNTYRCDICACEFTSFMDYFDHQETHDGQPVFKCSKCDEIFSTRKHLVEHEQHHKIACNICKLEVLPKSMTAHLLIHSDVHKCVYCDIRHTSNASLEKHVKARHTGLKGFVCHICGKQSSCQSSMNRHMAYHRSDRPYQCNYCDFTAKSLNIVQVHTSRKHLAEKCICEICAKLFKSQLSLAQHMKRIHTPRKHTCEMCSKAFIERYNLSRHLKKHVGHRLHECKMCCKEFLTVRKLKEHMHSHRQGCINCSNCGKEFFYKKYYNKHVLKCKGALLGSCDKQYVSL